MPKVIRLKESDLSRIVKRVIREGSKEKAKTDVEGIIKGCIGKAIGQNLEDVVDFPPSCIQAGTGDMKAIQACISEMSPENRSNAVKLSVTVGACIAEAGTKDFLNRIGGGFGGGIPTDSGSW